MFVFDGRGISLEKYINSNQVLSTLNVKSYIKPSAFSLAKPVLPQATAVCTIAWQQALPEALVSSQVETDIALKHCVEVSLVVEVQ